MLDCSPVCELLWDVCGDCVLSLLEIMKKMKRAGDVGQMKCKPTAYAVLRRAGKVVGELKMSGLKDFF